MSCKFGRPGTLFFRIPSTRYILPIVIEKENEILKKKGRGELETWLDTFKVTPALAARDDAMHWRVPQVSHQNDSLEDAYWASFITYDAQAVWEDGGYSATSYRRFCTVLENMERRGSALRHDKLERLAKHQGTDRGDLQNHQTAYVWDEGPPKALPRAPQMVGQSLAPRGDL
jgi:hypothetical protein